MRENWKVGKHKWCVVSDVKQKNTNFPTPPNKEESDDSDIEYYGGYLVCESVGNENAGKLIAAAPDLLEALIQLKNKYGEYSDIGKIAMLAIKKATE